MKYNTNGIVVVSFEPTEDSNQSETFIFYYDSRRSNGLMVDPVFVQEDCLRRIKQSIKGIANPHLLTYTVSPEDDVYIMDGDKPILLMGVQPDSIIQQED